MRLKGWMGNTISSCKRFFLVISFTFLITQVKAQSPDSLNSVNRKRLSTVTYSTAGVYVGTLLALNQLWYSDYDRSNFHFFNDNRQWQAMDKVGHIYSSYLGGSIGYSLLRYSGVDRKKSILYGGSLGFVFLSTVEVFDGFSEEWGFSWGDMAANALGSGVFIAQQYHFEKQIVQLKFSYSPSSYRAYRPEILGENYIESVLKDYNGQTYWASFNLNSMFSSVRPQWLNLAFGYGAGSMINSIGEYRLPNGEVFKPERQYYLALDIDLTRIKTESKALKTLFKALNVIKLPSPSYEINTRQKNRFYWLFF